MDYLIHQRKFHLLKNLLKKLNLFYGQQTPIIRIGSLLSNVTNYYSVIDNIFQFIVDSWHMLLVNDDVGFSLAFFVQLCVLLFKIFFFTFLCVYVWVCA